MQSKVRAEPRRYASGVDPEKGAGVAAVGGGEVREDLEAPLVRGRAVDRSMVSATPPRTRVSVSGSSARAVCMDISSTTGR
ncbi:hypothetical protein Ga0074812_14932 [Parafrankia irregularis]|uniref:Uncharacterized protein n=1 Tax=Parafrankia irregularis TaxID=795642 RepID=A0A0S4R1I0_9ACTN|nr:MULTISPECIES: hypothetical protein [Frankiaceae]KPM50312.1 hypothetical protein ACG83_40960 [Frankia sp. R43]MBE3204708.1 hypothetical protein [Parafrankia sp. CH37]CUU60888.1 hypothetical protein Ga0074812_14932 [Parafrankia irregularis]